MNSRRAKIIKTLIRNKDKNLLWTLSNIYGAEKILHYMTDIQKYKLAKKHWSEYSKIDKWGQ